MNAWSGALVSVVAVSLMSLIAVTTLPAGRQRLLSITTWLVSLAVGALLGGAFLHLIPLAQEQLGHDSEAVWLLVLSGFVASFVLEKGVAAHTHGHERHARATRVRQGDDPRNRRSVVAVVLTGDSIHNFVDGILIAGAWLADPSVGVITTVIVLLHEVPQELGDFGVLVQNGLTARHALWWNFVTATTAIAGALLALLIGSRIEGFAAHLVPLAAGNFIYVAAADLVPQLHERRGVKAAIAQLVLVTSGVIAMLLIHRLRHSLLGD